MSLNVTQNSVNTIINVSQSNIEATLTVTQDVNSYLLKATQENKVTNINPVVNTSSETTFIEEDPIFTASEAFKFESGDKDNLDNQSGINTGDETSDSIKTKRPLKTVVGKSIEGVGNIEVSFSDISGEIPISSLEEVTAVGSSSSRTIQIPEGVNSDDAVNKSQLDQKVDNRLEGLVVGLSVLEKDTIKQKLDIVNDKTYTHTQSTPSNFWICNHNLGKKVSITVTDSAGSIAEGEVIVLNNNSVQIKFNNSFWGYAHFN